MTGKTEKHVFFVDDEAGTRRLVERAIKRLEYKVSCFASAEHCLNQLNTQECNLLITDMHMPGMDGLALLQNIKHIAPWIPVVIVTGYGDIPTAVAAMKAGAVDFIEKPFEIEEFAKRIKNILTKNDSAGDLATHTLTKTEKKILKLILDGKSNKEIAYLLKRSIRTVEFHRANIMEKFDADNIVSLVKKISLIDLNA